MKREISNVEKLIVRKVSIDAVPKGAGFKEAITFLTDKNKISETYKNAKKWVKENIQLIREAVGPYSNSSDEEIAGVILKEIEKKEGKN